jgi:hydrogenase/urease accessory protein HupE
MTRLRRALLPGVLLLLIAAPDLFAHVTQLAKGEIRVGEKSVTMRLEISAHDLAVALALPADPDTAIPIAFFTPHTARLSAYLRNHLNVTSDGTACSINKQNLSAKTPASTETILLVVAFVCAPDARQLAIQYRLFFDIDPRHRFLGNLIFDNGRQEAFLFDAALTRLDVSLQPKTAVAGDTASDIASVQAWSVRAGRIFLLGIEHILIGFDHILFLIALILLDPRIGSLVRSITAFTVTHSITLALAWLGIFTPPELWVEVVIAASIVFVALENLLSRPLTSRWKIAGLFGLVHGLGFYSVLNALELGKSDALTTLLAFNLGIEVGQLAIIIVVALPLLLLRNNARYRFGVQAASLGIAAIGLWLLVERTEGVLVMG